MEPFCRIRANGHDVTGGLADRLLSIECHDEAETKSDRVTLQLDDRPRFSDSASLALPLIGTTVEVVMGYRDGASASMGTYLIDDISVDEPPAVLTVTGRAAAMNRSFRTPRTESFHQTTLGEIMRGIAERNGYEPRIDAELDGVVVRHIDQHNESDMAFASRLAELHDAVAKPVAGKLAVAKRGTGKAVSGAALPEIVITPAMCSSWRFQYSARDEAGEATGFVPGDDLEAQYAAGDSRLPQSEQSASTAQSVSAGPLPGDKGGVRAYWNDIRSGTKKEVTVGLPPYHELRYTHHNEAEAMAAARTYLNKSLRGKAQFSCDVGGDVRIQAEAKLTLSQFRPYIPTLWRIKTAKHRYQPGGGYSTSITAELFVPDQPDVAQSIGTTSPGTDDLIDGDIIHLPT